MKTKTCPNCDAEVSADSKYCSNCGKPFLKKVKVGLSELLNQPAKKVSRVKSQDKLFASMSTEEKLNALNVKIESIIKILTSEK